MEKTLLQLLNTGRPFELEIDEDTKIEGTVRAFPLRLLPDAIKFYDMIANADPEKIAETVQTLVVQQTEALCDFLAKSVELKLVTTKPEYVDRDLKDPTTIEIMKYVSMEVLLDIINEVIVENTGFFTKLRTRVKAGLQDVAKQNLEQQPEIPSPRSTPRSETLPGRNSIQQTAIQR